MRKTGITVTAIAVALIAIFLLAGQASAQGLKIGFVKDERLFSEYREVQKAQEEFEVMSRAWDDEAQTKYAEVTEMVQDYEKQKVVLSDDARKEREAAIRVKEEALDNFTRSVFGPGGQKEQKNAQLMQPLLDKIHRAIEAVAVDGNFDVVFTLQGIGYIKESFDVTDKVLEKLADMED